MPLVVTEPLIVPSGFTENDPLPEALVVTGGTSFFPLSWTFMSSADAGDSAKTLAAAAAKANRGRIGSMRMVVLLVEVRAVRRECGKATARSILRLAAAVCRAGGGQRAAPADGAGAAASR
ncbi:MAG: hypothetical protein LT106_17700 [Burkholderiaceae bacterium]|nr:hypothetical protein [Burkholderiaceae bacterium]